MTIALAVLSESINVDSITSQINISTVFRSSYPTKDKQLADIGIRLEEKILLENHPIDNVLVVMKSHDLNHCELNYSNLWNLQTSNDTVHYLSADYGSAFYCKSHVFATISNLYKLDFNQYHFKNLEEDTVELLAEKILFMINRVGFDTDVK